MEINYTVDSYGQWVKSPETPESKLKRLEDEQRRVADELGAVRKRIEEAKKPPKTRGEVVAERMIVVSGHCEDRVSFSGYWAASADGRTVEDLRNGFRREFARVIDTQRAAAKAEQKEADAKAARGIGGHDQCDRLACAYVEGRLAAADAIRNQK